MNLGYLDQKNIGHLGREWNIMKNKKEVLGGWDMR